MLSDPLTSKSSFQAIKTELLILLCLAPHKNVQPVLGFKLYEDLLALVSEFMDGGNLEQYLQDSKNEKADILKLVLI